MSNIKFNKNENKGPVVVLCGKRDTGKSVLIKDLFYHQKDLPNGLVISGTEKVNHFYEDFIPKCFIHHKYEKGLLEQIVAKQEEENELNYGDNAGPLNANHDPRTFVVMDDCLFDDKWTRDTVVRFLFMNGRHWKVMFVIAMQYPLGIGPVLRTNVDYVFILREPYEKNRKRLYENYASIFPTFELFCSIMDQTTENYECLVIDNNVKSNKLADCVFWYKAQQHPPKAFRVCHESYWKASELIKQRAAITGPTSNEYDSRNSKKRKMDPVLVEKEGASRPRYW